MRFEKSLDSGNVASISETDLAFDACSKLDESEVHPGTMKYTIASLPEIPGNIEKLQSQLREPSTRGAARKV